MTVKTKRTKRKDAKAVREITTPKLVYPTYKKTQPRKKGKTFTPTELKELRKLAEAHDEETGYALLDVPVKLPPDPTIKKVIDSGKEAKTKLEKQRRKAEAVKDLTPEETREKVPEMVEVTTMKKDEKGVMKKVTEFVVAADPKLKEMAAMKRIEIRPPSKEEIQRIKATSVRQKQMLLDAASLYQDQLRATKFLATISRMKVRPFPKKGYSIYKIMEAYRKRKPKWRLKIRRDFHRDEVHMKMVAPNQYLRGREEVHKEVQKILILLNMRMTPDATIRDVRPPRVGKKYRWVHIAVKARKLGEGEISSRL